MSLQPEEDADKDATLDIIFGGALLYPYLKDLKSQDIPADSDRDDALIIFADFTIAAMAMALEDSCNVFNLLQHYRVR